MSYSQGPERRGKQLLELARSQKERMSVVLWDLLICLIVVLIMMGREFWNFNRTQMKRSWSQRSVEDRLVGSVVESVCNLIFKKPRFQILVQVLRRITKAQLGGVNVALNLVHFNAIIRCLAAMNISSNNDLSQFGKVSRLYVSTRSTPFSWSFVAFL